MRGNSFVFIRRKIETYFGVVEQCVIYKIVLLLYIDITQIKDERIDSCIEKKK